MALVFANFWSLSMHFFGIFPNGVPPFGRSSYLGPHQLLLVKRVGPAMKNVGPSNTVSHAPCAPPSKTDKKNASPLFSRKLREDRSYPDNTPSIPPTYCVSHISVFSYYTFAASLATSSLLERYICFTNFCSTKWFTTQMPICEAKVYTNASVGDPFDKHPLKKSARP
jgi:hypothetical protein